MAPSRRAETDPVVGTDKKCEKRVRKCGEKLKTASSRKWKQVKRCQDLSNVLNAQNAPKWIMHTKQTKFQETTKYQFEHSFLSISPLPLPCASLSWPVNMYVCDHHYYNHNPDVRAGACRFPLNVVNHCRCALTYSVSLSPSLSSSRYRAYVSRCRLFRATSQSTRISSTKAPSET